MAFPDDLLEQAAHLARREPKRPKQASLRRAVSTAYYAMFHLLILETTKNWKRPAERSTLARMFDHGPMGKACASKRDELTAYFKTNPAPGRDPDVLKSLRSIAATFVQMLQYRHTADYDNSARWSRTDVIEKIESVQAAFDTWKVIKSEHAAQDFLVTLLLKERKGS